MSIPTLVDAFNHYTNSRESLYERNHEQNLCRVLDGFSVRLAKDEGFRRNLPHEFPSLWANLLHAWRKLQPDWVEQSPTRDLVLSLSRFTRNLVASTPDNQNQAFPIESEIRRMLHWLSSFAQLQNETLHPINRLLVQTLSNLVTLNEDLGSRLWDLYTTLPEDQDIITRLLASPDTRTIDGTLVLILNSINAKGQARQRLASPNCLRILIRILDRTEAWVESGEGEEGFTIAYRLFGTFLEQNLAGNLFQALAIEDEPITPHQISFLKVIDSYLRHAQPSSQPPNSSFCDYTFLPRSIFNLCSYSQHAIRPALGLEAHPSESSGDGVTIKDATNANLKELDLRLPKVCAAIILISQCLTTILLNFRTVDDVGEKARSYAGVLDASLAEGFVESVIETLRLVDRLLPRIVFGEAVATPGQAETSLGVSTDTTGFYYLKRDLVRLLGIITHGRRNIQDRIRECDGIRVVMSLCVIDERNPYLQEHALFALRNIIYQNPDNQAIVKAFEELT